jgi:hypothetical protein
MQPDVCVEEICLVPQGQDSYRPQVLTIGVAVDGDPTDKEVFTTVDTINCNSETKLTILESCTE